MHCRYGLEQSDEHLRLAADDGLLDDDFDYGRPSFHSPLPDHLIRKETDGRKEPRAPRKRTLDSISVNNAEDAKRLCGQEISENNMIYYVPMNTLLVFVPCFHRLIAVSHR